MVLRDAVDSPQALPSAAHTPQILPTGSPISPPREKWVGVYPDSFGAYAE